MSLDDPATAEGDFQRTPLPHLLVYMADRRLTGALFLCEPSGTEHVVRFEWGAPVKVSPGDSYALFGELLVEAGVVTAEVIHEALATKGLLGDVLILSGHTDPPTLERVAADQHERRIVRLFGLPADTSYRYFDRHSALADMPGRVYRNDVLRVLMAGLRAHPRSGMSLSRLLEKLGEMRLRLHPDAELERFGWTDEEACVATTVLMDRPTFVDLLSAGVADAGVVRRVVYALLLTRQLDFGHKLPPLGVEDTPPVVALGRVQLTAAIHRAGAAAPDLAGDGERAAVVPRTLRRRKAHTEPHTEPQVEAPSDAPPGIEAGVEPSVELGVEAGVDPAVQLGVEPEADEQPVSDVVEIAGAQPQRRSDTGTAGSGATG